MNYCLQCMKPLVNGHCPDGCHPQKEIPPHILPPGTLLNDRYLVGRALGQGGFGITYIGRDRTLDIRVAIKEYYPSGMVTRNITLSPDVLVTGLDQRAQLFQESEKFLAEARTLAKFIGEPGIVEVRDYFRANNTAYIIMEYLDGETLRAHLQRQGTLSPERTFTLLEPVMRSLEAIHQAGLIHRDISPDNIMLVKNGAVKLLDFGTARSASPSGEQSLSVMLKPGYAPEEQYRSKGSQGPWTDVYALCATMYKCMTGVIPDDSLQRLYEDTVKPPSRLGVNISPKQEAALMRGMACRMRERYQSVGALANGLGMTGFRAAPQTEHPSQPQTVRMEEEEPETPPGRNSESPLDRKPPQGENTESLLGRKTPQRKPPEPERKTPPENASPSSGAGSPPPVKPAKKAFPLPLLLGGVAACVLVLAVLLGAVLLKGRSPNDSGDQEPIVEDTSLLDTQEDGGEANPQKSFSPQWVGYTLGAVDSLTTYPYGDDDVLTFEDCFDGEGVHLGYCIEVEVQGFSGPLRIKTAVNTEGQVTGVGIVYSGEDTVPEDCLPSYVGRRLGDEDIDTATGATVTSRAVTQAVDRALEIVPTLDDSLGYSPAEAPTVTEVQPETTPESPQIPLPDPKPEEEQTPASIPTPTPVQEPAAEPSSSGNSQLGNPSANLNRADAALLVANYLGMDLGSYSGDLSFSDCGGLSLRQRQAVNAMLSAGILSGTSSSSFSPDDSLTRSLFLMMLHRAAGSPPASISLDCAALGVDEDAWYLTSVAWAVEQGIIPSDQSFRPNDIITVGEAQGWL